MGLFSMCCSSEDGGVDLAQMRRVSKVVRRNQQQADLDKQANGLTVEVHEMSTVDERSTWNDSPSSASSGDSSGSKHKLAKKVSDALCLKDDDGNKITPMSSLEQAKGVLEGFSHPTMQSKVADLVNTFLFGKGDQELFVTSCSKGNIALSEKDHEKDAEVVYKLKGVHEYIGSEKVNHINLQQELHGMLKLEELFRFIRNVNEIASSSVDPVHEDDLMDALGDILPQLSKLLGLITEEDSGDIWLERDEETNSVHCRFEAILDIPKISETEYSSVAETLKRAHSLDCRMMQLPKGGEGVSKDELRDLVKGKQLNDFGSALMIKVLSTKYGHQDGKARKKNRKNNCLLRIDFCIQADASDLLWMNPQTCLPKIYSDGTTKRVDFDETDHQYTGRCLIGFELTAGVSELGCATISLPKMILCVDYHAEEAVDHSGVTANIDTTPLYIDWNRLIRFLARPLIDLNKLEHLLMNEFHFKCRIGPSSSSLESVMERRGVIPGYGLFPDVPAELDPWSLNVHFKAKMVRPAGIVTSFIKTYVSSQVTDFGELTLWKDLTVAFVGDLQALCA